MDIKEASAMTEASGLVSDPDISERMSPRDGAAENKAPLLRVADLLQRTTVAAPLSSLFVAFLCGVWLARRR